MANLWNTLENKWYSFLDSLDSRGIPVYKVIDPIESSGIPSFPLFVGVAVLLVLALVYLGTSGGAAGLQLTVKAVSDGKALEGASVSASYQGSLLGVFKTGEDGSVMINVPGSGNVSLAISKKGCEKMKKDLTVSENKEITVKMQCGGIGNMEGCVELPETLEAVNIMGEGSQDLHGCKVYAVHPNGVADDLSWDVSDNQLFVSNECISQNDTIRVECDGFTDDFLPSEILDAMKTGETLYLTATSYDTAADYNNDGVPDFDSSSDLANDLGTGLWDTIDDDNNGIPDTYETWDTTKMIVEVKNERGTKDLNDIMIKAILPSGDDVKDASGTSVNGIVTLTVPKTQIKLVAEDPAGEYATYTTPPFYPIPRTIIKMKKGLKTSIKVTAPDGRGIGGATVLVNKNITLRTNIRGIAEVTLPNGNFDIYAFKDGYAPGYTSITSGETGNISLEKLTKDNSGSLVVHALNPEKGGDPFPRVKIRLETDGLVAGECTTPATGKCVFRRLKVGDYTILAMAPGGIEFDEIDDGVTVELGKMTMVDEIVYPAEIPIRIRTMVGGKPTDSSVTLFRTYPDIEEVDTQSTQNSYAQFNGYYGITYYLKAVSKDGESTGFLGPFTLENPVDETLYLGKPKESIRFEAPPFIERGVRKTAKLVVGLPYEDETMKTTYDEIDAYVWLGEPGDKSDADKTPVLIDRMETPDMQTPKIGIKGYSEFNEDLTSSVETDTKTSKGIKVTITDYSPGVFSLNIPLLARKASTADYVTVHYRVDYGDNEGKWKTVTISLSGGDNYTEIPEGDFYAFTAGLSTTPDGTPENSIIATKDSVFYLIMEARARDYTEHPNVDVELVPDGMADVVAYSGTIISNGSTYEIPRTESSSIDVLRDSLLKALNPDDVVDLTVEMEAEDNGTVTVIPFSDDGATMTLTADIKSVSWTPTPVPNVEGGTTAQARIEPPEGYLGYTKWKAFDVLPAFSISKGVGRKIRVALSLKNTGADSKTVNLFVNATNDGGKMVSFDYPSTVTVPGGCHNGCTKTVDISATGVPGTGEIEIYVWQGAKPDTPWKTIEYEPNDYYIGLESYANISGKANTFSSINEFTESGKVWIEDNPAYGDEYLPSGRLEYSSTSSLDKEYDDNGNEIRTFTGTFVPGENVTIYADSSVADLAKEVKAEGTAVNPQTAHWNDTLGNSTHQVDVGASRTHNVSLTNYWKSNITIDPEICEGPLGTTCHGTSWNPGDGYEFSINVKNYDANGNVVGEGSQTIAPGHTAVVVYTTKVTGAIATQHNHTNVLKIGITTSSTSTSKTLYYYQDVSANVTGGTVSAPNIGEIEYSYGGYIVTRDFEQNGYPTCDVTLKKDDNNNLILLNAKLCDAEQIGDIIQSEIDDLKDSSDVAGPTLTLAVGNDIVLLNQILDTPVKIVSNSGASEITCGIIKEKVYRLYNRTLGDYKYYVRVAHTDAPWCHPGDQSFFIGLLNYDISLLSTEKNDYNIKDENSKWGTFPTFLGDAQFAKDHISYLFPSDNNIILDDKDEHYYTIRWVIGDKSYISNEGYDWVLDKMGNANIVGFARWYPEITTNSPVSSGHSREYLLGVAYDDSLGTSSDTIKDAIKCFISNMFYHWITGNNTFTDESLTSGTTASGQTGNITTGLVIPLTNCEFNGVTLDIPTYDFSIITAEGDATDNITNSTSIFIKLTDDENVGYCKIWKSNSNTPSDEITKNYDTIKEGVEFSSTLEDNNNMKISEGTYTFHVVCYGNKSNVEGPIITHDVTIDWHAPQRVSGFPQSITISNASSNFYLKWLNFTLEDNSWRVIPLNEGTTDICKIKRIVYTGDTYELYDIGNIINNETVAPDENGGSYRKKISMQIGFKDGFNSKTLTEHYLSPMPPGTNTLAVVCRDAVGNSEVIGTFRLVTSSSSITIEEAPEDTCTWRYGNGNTKNCGFVPSEGSSVFSDVVQNTKSYSVALTPRYYTNGTNSIDFYVHVTSLAGIESCVLDVDKISSKSGLEQCGENYANEISKCGMDGSCIGKAILNYIQCFDEAIKDSSERVYEGSCALSDGDKFDGIYKCPYQPDSQIPEGEYTATINCQEESP